MLGWFVSCVCSRLVLINQVYALQDFYVFCPTHNSWELVNQQNRNHNCSALFDPKSISLCEWSGSMLQESWQDWTTSITNITVKLASGPMKNWAEPATGITDQSTPCHHLNYLGLSINRINFRVTSSQHMANMLHLVYN